mmetsp:Transcript_24002/g.36991  ORF Transcript_24002/g.36991 Transcript_24002/m.36991 type:complete len:94 (-) Transcript_24002:68-349(-)
MLVQRGEDMDLKRKRDYSADCEKRSAEMVNAQTKARSSGIDDISKLLQVKKDLLMSQVQLVNEGVPKEEVDLVLLVSLFDGCIETWKEQNCSK